MFFGTTLLTAFTDNAALTYLGSLVNGLSDPFKYALVAGAVTGGGLTVIANAPNPAGLALLRNYFEEESVSPAKLALAALPPTIIAAAAFLPCEMLTPSTLIRAGRVVLRCVAQGEDSWPSQPTDCSSTNGV